MTTTEQTENNSETETVIPDPSATVVQVGMTLQVVTFCNVTDFDEKRRAVATVKALNAAADAVWNVWEMTDSEVTEAFGKLPPHPEKHFVDK